MTHQFAISPDVHARDLNSWFFLNTRIQRMTNEGFRATIYDSFTDLDAAYTAGQVDLVFANTADAARLVRDHGYIPIANPVGIADEATVVASEGSSVQQVEELASPLTVAATEAPDVERICRILIEPADLGPTDVQLSIKRNYVLVAKALLNGEVQVGFFLKAAYDDLSEVIRNQLRPIISSQIHVVHHCLLASESIAGLVDPIRDGLAAMAGSPADAELLEGLGAPNGWEPASMEDVQFMIDLMAALEQQ